MRSPSMWRERNKGNEAMPGSLNVVERPTDRTELVLTIGCVMMRLTVGAMMGKTNVEIKRGLPKSFFLFFFDVNDARVF